MAAKQYLHQIDSQILASLTTPTAGFIGFAAKLDGLYQKIGTVENRLLIAADIAGFPYKANNETISGLWNFATAPTIQGNSIWHAGNLVNPVTGNATPFAANALIKATGTGNQVAASGVTVDLSNNVVTAGTIQATTAKLTNLTDGYIPYHVSDASGLGNSLIFQNATGIGIGTSTPTKKLELAAAGIEVGLRIAQNGYAIWDLYSPATSTTFRIKNGAGDKFIINNVGNVGIGYSTGTEITNNKLAVNGSGYFNTNLTVKGLAGTGTRLATVSSTGVVGALVNGADGYIPKIVSGAITWVASSVSEVYRGTWSAATNTPTLANGTGTAGDYYICSAAGTVNFGAGNITFVTGDRVSYNGSIWQYIQGVGYNLQAATTSVLGGVKIGSGVTVQADGTISVSTDYRENSWVPAWTDVTSRPTALSEFANDSGFTTTQLRANAYSYLSGNVTIQQGSNISITQTGSVIEIAMPVDFAAAAHNHTGVYEPLIPTKNTAFNKNFGTTAGTVLEGRTFGTAANSATTDFAAAIHTHAYDNYGGWSLLANSTNATSVLSGGTVNFIQGDNVSISKSGNNITINVPTIGTMVYPTAGIAVSTGSAWGTSIANNSANWNSAYDNMYKVGLGYYTGGYKMSPSEFWYSGDFIVLQKTDVINSGNNYPATSHGVFGALQEKQATLVSGTNIKTINGASILGSGDLTVGGSAAHSITSHTDVAFTYSPSSGDLMQYNGSAWTQRSINAAGIAALAGSLTQQFSTQKLNLPGGGYIEVQSNNIHIYPGSTQVVVHGQVTADSFYKN